MTGVGGMIGCCCAVLAVEVEAEAEADVDVDVADMVGVGNIFVRSKLVIYVAWTNPTGNE
jgi:hypothetical protein